MTPEIAAALVGPGMISLLVYPQLALALRPGAPPSTGEVEQVGHRPEVAISGQVERPVTLPG